MSEVVTNIDIVFSDLRGKISELAAKPEPILRAVAIEVMAAMRPRIHRDGKDASGAQIGTYSPGYMVIRTGNFKNADRYSRGAKKGKNKNSGKFTDRVIRLDKNTGVFSGEEKVGTARPQYHRSSDPKVIISLTSQLEQDYAIIDTPNGIGIGFNNPLNFKKAGWVEEKYKKPILTGITPGEQELAAQVAETELQTFFSGYQK